MSAREAGKNWKEWIVFVGCLMLLALVWEQIRQTADRPQSFQREILERAASQQDDLINSMLVYLESNATNHTEDSEKHAYLRDKLKKCQGISAARAEAMDYCHDLEPQIHRQVLGNSIVTVTIIGFCIILILFLYAAKSMFSWQRMVVCLLLSIIIATGFQRPVYWGALSAMESRIRNNFFGGAVTKYEIAKIRYFEKYYPEALSTKWNSDP